MCRNHRTIYTCHHFHETITLCAPVLAPLIYRATVFPYTSPLPAGPGSNHDIILSAETSNELCVDCLAARNGIVYAMPDLDVFDLDRCIQKLDRLDAQKAARAAPQPRYRRSICVDPALYSFGPVIKTSAAGPAAEQTRGMVHVPPAPSVAVAATTGLIHSDHIVPALAEAAASGMQNNRGQCLLKNGSAASVPYTGGLGLLVSPKRNCTEVQKNSERLKRLNTVEKLRPNTMIEKDARIMAKL